MKNAAIKKNKKGSGAGINVLLVGPFDPSTGIRHFVTPPLGIWRIAGFLRSRGIDCQIFDPNISVSPYEELPRILASDRFDIIGFSMTGMTLPYDLSLVHLAKRFLPGTLIVAGGVEATFNYPLIMSIAPVDAVVLGEGELPMLGICEAIRDGKAIKEVQGLVTRGREGYRVNPHRPMSYEEFREASLLIPLEEMPYALQGILGPPEEGLRDRP